MLLDWLKERLLIGWLPRRLRRDWRHVLDLRAALLLLVQLATLLRRLRRLLHMEHTRRHRRSVRPPRTHLHATNHLGPAALLQQRAIKSLSQRSRNVNVDL